MSEPQTELEISYWRANRRLIVVLIAIWGAVSLGAGILLVRPLNTIHLGTLPLGFWIAQQGAIYVFVALIFFYAWRMDRMDRAHRFERNGEEPPAPKA